MNHTATPLQPALSIDRTRRGITITALQPDGVAHVGTFRSIAEAWQAIDALDSPTED